MTGKEIGELTYRPFAADPDSLFQVTLEQNEAMVVLEDNRPVGVFEFITVDVPAPTVGMYACGIYRKSEIRLGEMGLSNSNHIDLLVASLLVSCRQAKEYYEVNPS